MSKRAKMVVLGASAVVLAAGGAGVAVATGGDDSEAPISGTALDEAGAAAIEHLGGGQVTETEVGDEESYYEVEVTLPSGEQTDVQLDWDFQIVSSETDAEDDD